LLRSLELKTLLRLRKGPRYGGTNVLDVRPAQRQNLTASRAEGGSNLQECRHALGPGRCLEYHGLLRRGKCDPVVLLYTGGLAVAYWIGGDQSPSDRARKRAGDDAGDIPDRLG
jgi:hypothetical protein